MVRQHQIMDQQFGITRRHCGPHIRQNVKAFFVGPVQKDVVDEVHTRAWRKKSK